ncbi:Ppx/GppA family phosphatase [Streptomyces sp. Vc74B-19]|uniref:Ppx/GppA phosphatase family protein n=1 Tax=unclassified Streptomyces TaxID=2593676 RepID=UPI001BFCCB91|nr:MULTISPECIES: Ppx/GppA phosphatase family protein [unclassified Streptomyces]MBT3167350.1 Ppx/GppA family phosphatase [Streptomyces sp. Vc74B-19]MCO4697887.1 Ppx/GppA family phosphatase [Streptomyces sp. RO-S4]MDU0303524.1 Ppx/GppA phosphatase family protein [Streptomyces sp. PAL114]
MRLGVLDVGSNTVHLLVVDAHPGARPLPAHSHKVELRLAQLLDDDGSIGPDGIDRLVSVVHEALQAAEDKGVEEIVPFATSAVRDARNADDVLRRVREETGVELRVLSGEDEAKLTFLAARRWFGWSSGKLLVIDIGGGSLEIAYGLDEEPDAAVSLPLGAGRLTAGWLPGDPPEAEDVRALRRHVRTGIARTVGEFSRFGAPDHVVATSKTFKQLARLAGAPGSAEGPYVQRELKRESLEAWVPRLAGMTAAERAELPGVSEARAGQLLAGAMVAEGAMDLFGVERLEICPWALREGVILRRLDHMGQEQSLPDPLPWAGHQGP